MHDPKAATVLAKLQAIKPARAWQPESVALTPKARADVPVRRANLENEPTRRPSLGLHVHSSRRVTGAAALSGALRSHAKHPATADYPLYADLLRRTPEHATNATVAAEAQKFAGRAEDIFAKMKATVSGFSGGPRYEWRPRTRRRLRRARCAPQERRRRRGARRARGQHQLGADAPRGCARLPPGREGAGDPRARHRNRRDRGALCPFAEWGTWRAAVVARAGAAALQHPAPLSGASYSAIELLPGDREVLVPDQRVLPLEERYDRHHRVEAIAVAIEALAVRGAPAIGIAAAYGLVLAAAEAPVDAPGFAATMAAAAARLHRTRPTAVNLSWALARIARVVAEVGELAAGERVARLAAAARAIHREDVASCRAMGRIGAARVPDDALILTHCNAGALATGGFGTALGVVRAAREVGKRVRVVACETRPVLQGARLTAWELARDGFDVTLITDSMVAQRMRRGDIDLVVVGADRIARSGDVANKIGTYGVACLAKTHGIPFYVAAPWSTIDLACPDGDAIPIEQRREDEMRIFGGTQIAPDEAHVENPAFDVTPASLVRAMFTERGEVSPPSEATLLALA